MRTFVVTGASSCGKTTIIDKLAELGHPVLHEVARELIADGRFHPRTAEFQKELAARHITREAALENSGARIAFLDRGLYDVGAFSRHFGQEVPAAVATSAKDYTAAFFLEPLGDFEQDGVRIESDAAEALAIGRLIREEYEARGVKCIDVPKMNIGERAAFILKYATMLVDSKRRIDVYPHTT